MISEIATVQLLRVSSIPGRFKALAAQQHQAAGLVHAPARGRPSVYIDAGLSRAAWLNDAEV